MRKKCPNILKRMGAILLVFMCLMMPMSAFAAGSNSTINDTQKGSITVYKYNSTEAENNHVDLSNYTPTGEQDNDLETAMSSYGIKDVTFTYVKVADIATEYVEADKKVQVVYKNIPAAVATALGKSGETQLTSDEINTALKNALSTSASATKDALKTYVTLADGHGTLTTNDNGYAKAENLSVGLYLMVETAFPSNISVSVDPFFVSIPMTKPDGDGWFYDVTVYPKNQTDTPTVDKLVRQDVNEDKTYNKTATGSIGDKMDYIFVSKLPQITDSTTYLDRYTFTDTIEKGLSYNKDAAIYFYDNADDANANATDNAYMVWNQGSANFDVKYEDTKMTITPTTDGYIVINTQLSGKYMVVAYSATITKNAVIGDTGNKNEVKLEWKRTSAMDINTATSDTKVYTYGLNVKKEFEGGSASVDATKVQFILQNTSDGYYVTATGDAGNYKVTKDTTATTEDKATKISPNASGALLIDGLEPDEYLLTEVKTAGGFSLLKDPITIVIRKDGTTSASATINGSDTNMSAAGDSANARVDLTVINHANFTLPMTGGAGTLLFTLAGCIVGLMAIVLITGKKKTE